MACLSDPRSEVREVTVGARSGVEVAKEPIFRVANWHFAQ